ncbi:MAG: response regulator transcription factor [Planctomycetota bacterium]
MTDKPHILVVDDEEHLAVGIKFNLEAEGFRVTSLDNGPEALAFVEKNPDEVSLVVLDLMLPGMSGYDVCQQLRDTGHEMPVLILSARTLTEDRTRGFDVGANQYLTKPFELDELISRVNNLIATAQRRTSQPVPQRVEGGGTYSFGDAMINFATYEILVGDKPVRLTQFQLKVLRYFIENEGLVISRARLLEDVWGLPATVNTRAPDQIIRQLRKTFEPDPAKPVHFLTIRDAGYRFVKEPGEYVTA